MLLLIIFVVLTIVCALILCHGPWDVDTDLPGAALGIVMLISGVAAFICICFLIGAKIPAFERAERIKREEQYKTIRFILDSDKIPGSDIIEQITDYNSMILTRQANNKSIWLRAYTYDFWDQMPLIELEEERWYARRHQRLFRGLLDSGLNRYWTHRIRRICRICHMAFHP